MKLNQNIYLKVVNFVIAISDPQKVYFCSKCKYFLCYPRFFQGCGYTNEARVFNKCSKTVYVYRWFAGLQLDKNYHECCGSYVGR